VNAKTIVKIKKCVTAHILVPKRDTAVSVFIIIENEGNFPAAIFLMKQKKHMIEV
jgi:hypothetical protein